MIKAAWTEECTQMIKETKRLCRECRTSANWKAYIKVCDRKEKILRKHKRNKFRTIMQISETISKNLFDKTKWTRNAIANTLTQAIILSLNRDENIVVMTTQKIKVIFQTHFSISSKTAMSDIEEFVYSTFIEKDSSITKREMTRAIHKVTFDKAFEINKITNKALKQFVRLVST